MFSSSKVFGIQDATNVWPKIWAISKETIAVNCQSISTVKLDQFEL